MTNCLRTEMSLDRLLCPLFPGHNRNKEQLNNTRADIYYLSSYSFVEMYNKSRFLTGAGCQDGGMPCGLQVTFGRRELKHRQATKLGKKKGKRENKTPLTSKFYPHLFKFSKLSQGN